MSFTNVTYLALDHCWLPGLIATGLRSSGNVHLDSSIFTGEVRLANTRIGGDLVATDIRVHNHGGLILSNAEIEGAIGLHHSLLEGPLVGTGMRLRGDLDMTAAHVTNAGTRAIQLNGARVSGNVFLDNGFTCEGDVDLVNSYVGLTLNLTSCDIKPGTVTQEDRRSRAGTGQVTADSIKVDGSVFTDAQSKVSGGFKLSGSVDGSVYFAGSTGMSTAEQAVVVSGLTIGGDLGFLEDLNVQGQVLIESARIAGHLVLEDGVEIHSANRPQLTVRQSQVAGNLATSELGHKRQDLAGTRIGGRTKVGLGNFGHWLWDLTTGHGHQVWRVAVAIVGLIGVSQFVFRPAAMRHLRVDTEFEPLMYSLDVFLPFLNLGQVDAWAPATTLGLVWYVLVTVGGWVFGIGAAVALGQLFRRPQ